MDLVRLFNLLLKMEEAGMMNNEYSNFISKDELANCLSLSVADILKQGIKENGKVTLLLSGGNTPKLFLNTLSEINIDWEKVTVGLVDERCVSTTSKNSNENLIKTELCKNNAINLNFIGMSQDNYEEIYKEEFKNIDVLILGMGTDGHTASLFSYNEDLLVAFDPKNQNFCIKIIPETAPHKRISLTLNSILKAKNIFLHIEGAEKIKVYNEVIQSDDAIKYPIVKVLNSSNTIKVYAHE